MKQRTLYTIVIEDVVNIAAQENLLFTKRDLSFIEDKIGNYFGDKWQDAIKYALNELDKSKQPI